MWKRMRLPPTKTAPAMAPTRLLMPCCAADAAAQEAGPFPPAAAASVQRVPEKRRPCTFFVHAKSVLRPCTCQEARRTLQLRHMIPRGSVANKINSRLQREALIKKFGCQCQRNACTPSPAQPRRPAPHPRLCVRTCCLKLRARGFAAAGFGMLAP